MANSNIFQGYDCQFLDSVPKDFFHCKLCSLVARKITMTSCCGESYCNACILSFHQGNKPCPGCGEESFEIYPQVKYQKIILSLQVHCTLKDRGCDWSGQLEELDAHLDPDQGDCEHADIHCPLNCGTITKRKSIADHKTNECVKRDYICPYCSFKDTYEIVSGDHWPECSYYPLFCPNSCGVTCERQSMEDHRGTCPLEEMECEFQDVGCLGKFRREEEEEHMREKSQAHLTMMAAASAKMKQDFQTKLQEQEKKFEDELLTLKNELKRSQEEMLLHQQHQEEKLQEQTVSREEVESRLTKLEGICLSRYKFTMEKFSAEKAKDKWSDWKSPAMYTHMGGYKFCIGVDANGYEETHGNSIRVDLWAMRGENDEDLKWPVTARFTIELINHYPNGRNRQATITKTWTKPSDEYYFVTEGVFNADPTLSKCFIKHSDLSDNAAMQTHYLKDDALQFEVTKVAILK